MKGSVEQFDTIAAVSTGKGGAIGVIRLSGKDVLAVADRVFKSISGKTVSEQITFTLQYGKIIDGLQTTVDDVLLSVFRAPGSYTGEDMVEISCHGSDYIQQEIMSLLTGNGARIAEPGEFTMRAFLNGKMDLTQAEAVADIIASDSRASHRIALNQMRGGYSGEFSRLRRQLLDFASLLELELDFSEEDVEFADREKLGELLADIRSRTERLIDSFRLGNAIKNGVPVAIAGRPNVGKSTLLNALLKEERALVSDIAGTTRDTIEETVNINGIVFRFIDTAGIRRSDDVLENMGIERTLERVSKAEVVILVAECTDPAETIKDQIRDLRINGHQKLLVVLNKSDKADAVFIKNKEEEIRLATGFPVVSVSAREKTRVAELERLLYEDYRTVCADERENVLITNVRHYDLLTKAGSCLEKTLTGLQNNISADLISRDLREAADWLGSITGEISTDDILGNIFSKFCIGK